MIELKTIIEKIPTSDTSKNILHAKNIPSQKMSPSDRNIHTQKKKQIFQRLL